MIYERGLISNLNITTHRNYEKIKESQKKFINEIKVLNNSKNLNDKKFNEWAYTYLINNNNEFKNINYYPINHNQRSELITSFLDYLLLINSKNFKNLTDNLYRAWSQKKFRESNKKNKQSTLKLSKETQKNLTEISKKLQRTESEILSELIYEKHLELLKNTVNFIII